MNKHHSLQWGRINLPLFSTVVPGIIFMFLSCRPFVAITTLSTVTLTPTRPVDNVVIAKKGLQDRNILAGTTVGNKGKLILSSIYSRKICWYKNLLYLSYNNYCSSLMYEIYRMMEWMGLKEEAWRGREKLAIGGHWTNLNA